MMSCVLLVLMLLTGAWNLVTAQQATERFFPETGHWVSGEFLSIYNSVTDPLLVFGYPITDEFSDSTFGRKMQYFQRARLELDETAQPGHQVIISDLGRLVYERSNVEPAGLPTNTPACRPFTTSHGVFNICYAFLAFFNTHGGYRQFGYPISEYSIEGDQYVQYFERARFEFHPELPASDWVRLTDIGRVQFDQSLQDPNLLKPSQRNNGMTAVLQMKPRAFPARAVVNSNGTQTLFVVVQNQNNEAIPQALVIATIRTKTTSQRVVLPATNAQGISQYTFNAGELEPNQVVNVDIEVIYHDLHASTSTWYRGWW